jgi:signal transduction histidine kinase
MREWSKRHPQGSDAMLAGVVLFASTLIFFGGRDLQPKSRNPDGWFAVLHLLLALPLLRRRAHPRIVASCIGVVTLGIWLRNYPDGATALAGSISLYSLARYEERPGWLEGIRLLLPLVLVALFLAAFRETPGGWSQAIGRIAVITGTFAFGDSARMRAKLLESLEERARRAEADRASSAQRAVLDERARIARELHDVVAHSLSVMVVQSGAAERLIAKDPEAATRSVRAVADTGRDALSDMRRIFGVLDSAPDGETGSETGFVPQPTLADIDALVQRCRAAGLPVNLSIVGNGHLLPAGVQLSVYRIVQEGLTNVLKHAGRATANVVISVEDTISVLISDDGMGVAAKEAVPGSGRGLVGMRQRAEALDGSFHAAPKRGGGFEVKVIFP